VNARRLALVVMPLVVALAACGSDPPQRQQMASAPLTCGSTEPPVAAPTPTPKPASPWQPIPFAEAADQLRQLGFDFSRPIRQYGDSYPETWTGRPTLQKVLREEQNLAAAAIMTVIGPDGPPRWNTPDGHRWTQDEAIRARAQNGVLPFIETPWHFVRSGPTFVGSVPTSVEVWLAGGAVGQDFLGGGNSFEPPIPGRSYLLLFGPQQNLAPPGAFRVILNTYPYDPVTRALDGPWGRITLASGSRSQCKP